MRNITIIHRTVRIFSVVENLGTITLSCSEQYKGPVAAVSIPWCVISVFSHLPIADIGTLRIDVGIVLQKKRQTNIDAVRNALASFTGYYGMGYGAISSSNP